MVKRYTAKITDDTDWPFDHVVQIQEDGGGDFVLYSDYAELQEAVKWEIECDKELTRILFNDPSVNDDGFLELRDIYQASRKAISTLLENK